MFSTLKVLKGSKKEALEIANVMFVLVIIKLSRLVKLKGRNRLCGGKLSCGNKLHI